MEWIKSSIETTSAGVDAVTGILLTHGIAGVEIVDSEERARYFADSTRTWDYADEALLVPDSTSAFVIFYVTSDNAGATLIQQIATSLENARSASTEYGALIMRQEKANDETWLHEWKKHFVPIHIGRVVVVPEWVQYQPQRGEVIFTIDPGTAFGTGQHQTTKLCALALQNTIESGAKVLDIGCGSGILSIIALLLQASQVTAIDIDPAGAIAATKKNAELNPIDVSRLQVLAGDVLSDTAARKAVGTGYDLVVANIVADVIIPLAPLAPLFGKPGGRFIASGIISDRLEDVKAAFRQANITIVSEDEMEGWHCLVGVLANA